jgi:predicted component of type VI protein secretion system
MRPHVTLHVVRGHLDEEHYDFEEPTQCALGRAKDCGLHAIPNMSNLNVSRHHCVFDIDPPTVRIRDLGSRYGTFVNGKCIGHRPEEAEAEKAEPVRSSERRLNDGDEVRVGDVVLRVAIDAPEAAVPLMFF